MSRHGTQKERDECPAAARPPGQPHHPGPHPDADGYLRRGGLCAPVCPAVADPDSGLRLLSGAGGRPADRDSTVAANRGTIYDSNGVPLALSATVYNVQLSPKEILQCQESYQEKVERPREREGPPDYPEPTDEFIASSLAEILDLEEDDILTRLAKDQLHVRDDQVAGGAGGVRRGAAVHHREPHQRHLPHAHHQALLPQGQPGRPGDRLGEPQHGQHRRLRHRGPV